LAIAARVCVQEDWVLCRVFQKTKSDGSGDGQDGDSSSSPAFAGTSHAMPEPDHYSAASSGGYYGLAFAPQQHQEVAAVLPQYYGGTVVDDHHHHGFITRDDAGAALPAGFGAMRGVAGGEYGFGYFDMGGFDDMASLGAGDMEFPQVWS
jgi:hypothetical protein